MKMVISMMAVVLCFCLNGCVHTYWNERSELQPKETGMTNIVSSVRVGQYALLTKSGLSGFSFTHNGKKIDVGNYSTVGDVEMMESISKMITYGLIAYSSMGSVPAMEAILKAFQTGEVEHVIKKHENGETITMADMPVAASYSIKKNKSEK